MHTDVCQSVSIFVIIITICIGYHMRGEAISVLGHIKKISWLASLAFAKKWAGGRFFFNFY